MIVSTAVVEVAFRYAIFSLLAYKVYDLGKKYFLPYIDDQIKQEIQERNEILEKEKFIASTRLRIENQIERQKQLFVILEKNVQLWHASVIANRNNQEVQQRHLIQQLKEKNHKQQQRILVQKNARAALPKALDLAREELTKKYAGNEGKQFLKNVLLKTTIPSTKL